VGTPVIANVGFTTTWDPPSKDLLMPGVPAGALLVVSAASDEGHTDAYTVTSSPSLTWTKRQEQLLSTSGSALIATAYAASAGDYTITVSRVTGTRNRYVTYVITGHDEQTFGGASAKGGSASASAPSVNLTTTRDNSLVIGVVGDDAEVDGSGRVYRNAPVAEDLYGSSGTDGYWWHRVRATSGSAVAEGLTAPSNMRWGECVIEIRGPLDSPSGTSVGWSPGGLMGIGQTILERSWSTTGKRNLVSPQLYGGGDVEKSAAGFYLQPGAVSTISYDRGELWHGEGSIRWDVNELGTKLYMGWPSAAYNDPAPLYALAAVPGLQYTFGIYAKADASFSTQLNLQTIDKDGNNVGSSTNSGAKTLTTSWQLVTATITVPVTGVYVRPHLDNTASVIDRRVWVDAAQWVQDSVADTTPYRPSGAPVIWTQIRGASEIDDPIISANSPDELATVWDEEVPPGYTITYRARNVQPETTTSPKLGSASTPYIQTMLSPPGQGIWVLKDLHSVIDYMQVYIIEISEEQHTEATTYFPIRPISSTLIGQRPVVISDFIGGHDGSLTIVARGFEEWDRLQRLLAATQTLWIVFPDFGARYISITSRTWGRRHFFPGECEGLDGWLRTVTLSFLEVDRPSV